MLKKLFLICLILIAALPVAAQETITITATVNYPIVRVRLYPVPSKEPVTELHQGDEVIVHYYERIGDLSQAWVEVTVPNTDIHGWIRSDLLLFNRADWAEYVPDARTKRELFAYATQQTGGVYYATVWTGAESLLLNIRDNPHGGQVIAQIPTGSQIDVLGRATFDGVPSYYVYIHHQQTGVEGWAHSYFMDWDLGKAGFNDGIPVIYRQ